MPSNTCLVEILVQKVQKQSEKPLRQRELGSVHCSRVRTHSGMWGETGGAWTCSLTRGMGARTLVLLLFLWLISSVRSNREREVNVSMSSCCLNWWSLPENTADVKGSARGPQAVHLSQEILSDVSPAVHPRSSPFGSTCYYVNVDWETSMC